ncbi:FecR family protein [Paenirhodobacter sp.]|uniref:FecR family protein n=1 Tax=Paenirhodobacter sp. TaxID=1965326 RepID=UPI003B403A83
MTRPSPPIPEARLEEAAEWFMRLNDPGADAALRAAFDDWLAQGEEQRRAWERICGTWQVMGQRAPRRPVWPLAAAAVVLLAVGVLAGPRILLWSRADYLTQVAQTRTIPLEDGSVISLGAQSAVEIDMDGRKRRVRLLAGEAFFDVAPDPERPFVVTARDVRAKVLGTAFNVRLSEGATEIELARGSLRVAGAQNATLSPGDSITVSHGTGRMQRGHVPPADIASWRDGRIFVDDEPISAVVEQIRRYHPGWIRVASAELGRQRVTGLYDLRDPDSALRALVHPYGGRVRQISPWVTVLLAGS